MKIAITGASGFIGQHLLSHYLEKGAQVCAIIPDPEQLEKFRIKYPSTLELVRAGFENFNNISELVKMRDIDIFYYLSWSGYGKATHDYIAQIQNIKPLCDAVSESSKLGCKRFVFSSSFSEFMICENEALSHNNGAHCNVYGAVKQAARIIAHAVSAQMGVPFLSVAFANTFGVGDRSHRSSNLFVQKLLKKQPIDLTHGTHLYDWNYIEDTIAGLVAAGEKGKVDSVYYIGSNECRPLKEIVAEVRDILAPDVEIRLGTYHEDFHVDYSSIDVTKLYRDTGYRSKWKFKDAVIATAEWVKTLDIK